MILRIFLYCILAIYSLVFASKHIANNLNERLFNETVTETKIFNQERIKDDTEEQVKPVGYRHI